ncbi:Asp23/Gls24 family envelope stress response protein [Actinomycetota bacterium Odt1-20B]
MALTLPAGPPDDEAGDEQLPCGRSLADVWAAVDDGPATDQAQAAPHPEDCPHCAAAVESLAVLDDVVRRSRGAESAHAAPDPEAVAHRVMDLVRLELRPGRTLPLGGPDEDLWVAEAAAARTFRAAAQALPGVHAGSCRITPLSDTGSPQDSVRVRLEVAASWSWPVPELAHAVRRCVQEAADNVVGMDVAQVDVFVVDILDGEAEEGPA